MSADSVTSIAQMGSSMQSSKVQSDLAIAVARKSLDNQKMQGELAVQLVESARQAAPQPKGLIDTVA